MDSDWNPNIDIEEALEQLPDCNISFSDYTREIGDGFEAATNSSASVITVDPICRLELASMIAPQRPNKIGTLKPATDDKKADESEISYWLRVSGLEADHLNLKLNSKNTRNPIPIAEGKQAVSGVKNMFVDDDFFKLKAHPSQLLPFPKVLELPSNAAFTSHQANDLRVNNNSCDIKLQNSIITSSLNENDISKLNNNDEASAKDTTIFYTPREIYNIKKQQAIAAKAAKSIAKQQAIAAKEAKGIAKK